MSIFSKTKTFFKEKPVRIIIALCVIAAIMVAVGIGISALVKNITPKCLHGTYERNGVCYENYCKQDCEINGQTRDWSKPPNCPCKCESGEYTPDGKTCKPVCGLTKKACRDDEECAYYDGTNLENLRCVGNETACESQYENTNVYCDYPYECSLNEDGGFCYDTRPPGDVSQCEGDLVNGCISDKDCYDHENCSKQPGDKLWPPGYCKTSKKQGSDDTNYYQCCEMDKLSAKIDLLTKKEIITCCSGDEIPVDHNLDEGNITGCCPRDQLCKIDGSKSGICFNSKIEKDNKCSSKGVCPLNTKTGLSQIYDIDSQGTTGCCPNLGTVLKGTDGLRYCGLLADYPGEFSQPNCSKDTECGDKTPRERNLCIKGSCKLLCGEIKEGQQIPNIIVNDTHLQKSMCYAKDKCNWSGVADGTHPNVAEDTKYVNHTICKLNGCSDDPNDPNCNYWKTKDSTDANAYQQKIQVSGSGESCNVLSCAGYLGKQTGVYDIFYNNDFDSDKAQISVTSDGTKKQCTAIADCSKIAENIESFTDIENFSGISYWGKDNKVPSDNIGATWNPAGYFQGEGKNCVQNVNSTPKEIYCNFLESGKYCSIGSIDGITCLTDEQKQNMKEPCLPISKGYVNNIQCKMPYGTGNENNAESVYYCGDTKHQYNFGNTCCGYGRIDISSPNLCKCLDLSSQSEQSTPGPTCSSLSKILINNRDDSQPDLYDHYTSAGWKSKKYIYTQPPSYGAYINVLGKYNQTSEQFKTHGNNGQDNELNYIVILSTTLNDGGKYYLATNQEQGNQKELFLTQDVDTILDFSYRINIDWSWCEWGKAKTAGGNNPACLGYYDRTHNSGKGIWKKFMGRQLWGGDTDARHTDIYGNGNDALMCTETENGIWGAISLLVDKNVDDYNDNKDYIYLWSVYLYGFSREGCVTKMQIKGCNKFTQNVDGMTAVASSNYIILNPDKRTYRLRTDIPYDINKDNANIRNLTNQNVLKFTPEFILDASLGKKGNITMPDKTNYTDYNQLFVDQFITGATKYTIEDFLNSTITG